MRAILDAGFVFWGLFLVFALIVVGYLVWMFWEEVRARSAPSAATRYRDDPEAGGVE